MRWDDVPRGCHHQKSHVIDGELAFVGGINLTATGSRRQLHDARGHHDLFVELTVPRSPTLRENFAQRWNQATRSRRKATRIRRSADSRRCSTTRSRPRAAGRHERVVQARKRRSARRSVPRPAPAGWPSTRFDLAKGETCEPGDHSSLDRCGDATHLHREPVHDGPRHARAATRRSRTAASRSSRRAPRSRSQSHRSTQGQAARRVPPWRSPESRASAFRAPPSRRGRASRSTSTPSC